MPGHLTINNKISQNMHSLISPTCINYYAFGLESILVIIYIVDNCSKPWAIYLIQLRFRLLLSGDIETNPGPSIVFKHLTSIFRNNNKRIKFIHINAQSLLKKQIILEAFIRDLGPNTIFGISEIWLKNTDGKQLWNFNPNLFKTFRMDRNSTSKERGGGVMLIVPLHLNPKERKDLYFIDKNKFKSIWVECNLNTKTIQRQQKQLINVSYNPCKSLHHDFLEDLALSIDQAVVENEPLCIMGDFNIDYLTPREQQNLDTVILPYGLTVTNTKEPTRVKGQSRSLIDYIILDHFGVDSYTSFVSNTPPRTTKNEPIDHLATFVVSNIVNESFKKVIQKGMFDKRTYQKD